MADEDDLATSGPGGFERPPDVRRPRSGEFDEAIAASKAAPRTYRGARFGLPIAGPGSLGGLGARFSGSIIDAFVILPFAIAVRLATTNRVGATAVALLALVPSALYVIVTIGAFGRTIGQRASDLEVRTTAGGTPTWSHAVRRWILIGIAFVVAVVLGNSVVALVGEVVVLGWMFVDRDRQGLHDKLAGVVVVRTTRTEDLDRR
jgi:uncharacterized RDD family membrane protein YckC